MFTNISAGRQLISSLRPLNAGEFFQDVRQS